MMKDTDPSNVVKFPEPKVVPTVQETQPTASKPSPTVYRIGKTEDGKVTLSLGDYSGTVVTMNNAGVDQLIRMLEAAKDPEYWDNSNPTDDPDGGEPVPVPEEKVA